MVDSVEVAATLDVVADDMRKLRGEDGWVLLVVFIFLWDWFGPETLTQALWRGLAHPRKKWIVLACYAWVTSHLLVKKPKRILIWR